MPASINNSLPGSELSIGSDSALNDIVCVGFLLDESAAAGLRAAFIGVREGKIRITPLEDLPRLMDLQNERPREQWWQTLAPIQRLLAQPGPSRG